MKKFKDDYELTTKTDAKGREKQALAYRGQYFSIDADANTLANAKKTALMLSTATALIHLASGFLRNRGMFEFYISMPYIFTYLALWYSLTGILRIPNAKDKYRRDEIELSVKRAKGANKALLILFGISALGELFFLFANFPTGWHDYLYLALALLNIFLIYRLGAKLGKLNTTPIEEK